MPVRQNTQAGMRCQIVLQPGDLSTCSGNTDLGIQGVNPPAAEGVRIIFGNIIEVFEVPSCILRMVVMISGYGLGPGCVSSPGWPVAVGKLILCAIGIGIIASGENRAFDIIQQFCSRLIIVLRA